MTTKETDSATRPPAPATRSVTVPAPEDLELAKDDALLQLRIGRGAHLYAVFVSAALALDGVLLLFLYPSLPSLASGSTGATAFSESFFLLLPVLAALAVSVIGLWTKWEVYQLWPWELHFSVTVGALAGNGLIAVVYGLRLAGVGPFAGLALMPWFYPVELVGISAAFLGIVLTWNTWTFRQWSSAAAAVIPIATALLVYFPPSTTTGASSALAVSLFLSAILYQTSGSFLHLITSGTRPHERELITAGQSRMFRLAEDLRQREEALHFREAALVKREADVENSLISIKRQGDALKVGRQQLDDLELDYRKRSDGLVAKERDWAGQIARLDARERLVDDKSKSLELREQEVQRLVPQISAREQRLVEQEGRLTQREVELIHREQDLDHRAAATSETESRLDARSQELDQKTTDVLRREGDLAMGVSAGESGLLLTPRLAPELSARQMDLQKLQSSLDEQNVALGLKARQVVERARAADESLQRVAEREASLAARETAIAHRESELDDLSRTAEARRAQYETAAREYQSRLGEFGQQQVELAQRSSDLDRSLRSLGEREAALAGREQRLAESTAVLEQLDVELTARERALEAAEAEISLRRQEAAQRSADLPMAGLAAMAVADRLERPVLPSNGRPSTGRGRLRLESGADASTPEAELGSDTLSVPAGRRFADRLPTGTPRLDDLLLGGLPSAGHVVVLGDPFVGKEVVVYSFLAEGLKRGEPVAVVTALRSPAEVSESLGVVLPQLREYEQLGMVHWIDASGSGTSTDSRRVAGSGADDLDGILHSLTEAANAIESTGATRFRVGFLGLSAVLAHGDERVGFSFLQNVVGLLKPRKALAMYSLEGGALSDAQVETLLTRMDGAIVFRQDRDRTFLSVKGFGDVQTRDWIECRATQRSLIIGSFALERIR